MRSRLGPRRGLHPTTGALLDAWFDLLPADARALARTLQHLVLAADPGLEMRLKWGNLLWVHEGRHALALAVHKTHINLQVFNGHALLAQFPMLDGNGKGLRSLKCRLSQAPDEALVTALTQACVQALREAADTAAPDVVTPDVNAP